MNMSLKSLNQDFKEYLADNELNLLLHNDSISLETLYLCNSLSFEQISISHDKLTNYLGDIYYGLFEITATINGQKGTFYTSTPEIMEPNTDLFERFSDKVRIRYKSFNSDNSFHFSDTQLTSFQSFFNVPIRELKGILETLHYFGLQFRLAAAYDNSLKLFMEERVANYKELMGPDVNVYYEIKQNNVPYITFETSTYKDTFSFNKRTAILTMTDDTELIFNSPVQEVETTFKQNNKIAITSDDLPF